MRESMEEVLYDAGVDMVFNGCAPAVCSTLTPPAKAPAPRHDVLTGSLGACAALLPPPGLLLLLFEALRAWALQAPAHLRAVVPGLCAALLLAAACPACCAARAPQCLRAWVGAAPEGLTRGPRRRTTRGTSAAPCT